MVLHLDVFIPSRIKIIAILTGFQEFLEDFVLVRLMIRLGMGFTIVIILQARFANSMSYLDFISKNVVEWTGFSPEKRTHDSEVYTWLFGFFD